MKKFLLGIATLVTMAIICVVSASAETNGDYTYTVLSDGTVSITKYNGTATELAIPSVIDGKTVTTIGENCFSNNASLTSIVMPDTVLYAEKGAFMWCSKLTNITLSANLKTLGNNALRGNSLITSLKLPKTLESIGVDAFSLMNGLQSITVADDNNYFKTVDDVLYNKEMTQIILYPCQKTSTSYTMPDTVTEMSDKCFEYAKNLETITLSKNLTAISRYAFSDCRKLKSLTIPEGVTSIGDHAFKQSSALTTVHLPSTLTTIGDPLFFNNFHFTGFTINENNETFSVEDGILFSKDKTQLLIYPMGKPDKSYAVPESVTDIADHAFYYAAYIEKLSFGSKLNSFGNWTFCGCDSLTEVVIPESLTDFGRATFDGCDNLTEITIPSKVTKLSDYTFRDCGKLTKIEIKGTIKEILSYCFSGTPITSISFPAGLEKVDYGAFYNCSNLTDVNLPDTIIYMGHDVFDNTPFQNNNPDKLKYAGNVLYYIDPETTIADVKEGTTVFASKILDDCTKLEEIILPDSLIRINDSAFSRCKTIKKITLGSNTQTIGENAFYYCQALEEINIPDSVTSIGKYAFAYCSSLVSVVIPDGIESLSEYTFSECTSLVSVVVPGNVKTIGTYCFKNCTALESAVLCRGVTELGSYAFRGCTSLKSLRIPDGVTTLYGTVYNCHSLEKLTVPDSALYFDGVVIAGIPKTASIHCSADSAFYNYINERYTEIITTGQYQKIDELTAISLCTAPTTTSIVFTWNATPVTESVEIQQLVNGTWTTVATVKNGSLGTYTLSGLTPATEYSFRARTYTGSGDTALYSAYTYKNTATEIEKITGFTSSDVTDNSLKLTWNKNSAATGYIVKQYKNGEWVKLADITACTYTVSGLSSCTDYVFSVTAYMTSGTGKLTSAPSRINVTTDHVYSSSFTIDKAATCTEEGSKSKHCTREGCNAKTSVTVIPMKGHSYTDTVVAPTYTEQGYTLHDCDNCDYSYKDNYKDKLALLKPVVTATAGDKQVTLSWTAVEGASYYQIIRYNKGTYSVVADINGTSAVVKGLTNNYEYTYLVKAVAEDGRSSLSSAVYVTPVAPLSKPVVKATAGDKQVTLSWTKVEGASHYQIIRYNKGTYSVVADINGTSAVVKGLTNNYEYTYLIKAVAEDGRSSLSSAVYVTPVAPLSKPVVKATAGDKQATLSWNAVSGASYYQIIRYNKGTYSVVADINSTSAVVKGLTNNYEYTYLVKAVAEDGRTSLSSAVYVTPVAPLSKPVVTATSGDKQVTLSWTKVEGANYYQIIRYNKGTYSVVADINSTSAVVKGLTNNYEYTYLIKAVAEDGRTSLSSAVYVTPVAALAKPVVKAAAGDKQVTLSWNAVSGASYYQIIRYNKGTYSVVADINGTSAVVKGLTNNFEYTYLIKVVMNDGSAMYSNAVNVTPKA